MFFTHFPGGSHRGGMKQHMEFRRENPFDLNSTEAPPQKRHVSSSDEFAGSSGLCCLSEGFSWKSYHWLNRLSLQWVLRVHAFSTSFIWSFGGRGAHWELSSQWKPECRICSSQFLLPGCNLGIMETLTHELSPSSALALPAPWQTCQLSSVRHSIMALCILSGDLFLGIKYGTCK